MKTQNDLCLYESILKELFQKLYNIYKVVPPPFKEGEGVPARLCTLRTSTKVFFVVLMLRIKKYNNLDNKKKKKEQKNEEKPKKQGFFKNLFK